LLGAIEGTDASAIQVGHQIGEFLASTIPAMLVDRATRGRILLCGTQSEDARRAFHG
jgi:hypothetical protein